MSLKFVTYGILRSSADVGIGSSLYEIYTATDAQTTFSLAGFYRPGTYELEVYLNGSRQMLGADYVEIDNKTVKFTTPVELGDTVLFSVQEMRNSSLYQEFTATAGQTVFVLTGSYHPRLNTLQVYDNGMLLRIADDYIETDEHTVTLTYPASENAKITFREIM